MSKKMPFNLQKYVIKRMIFAQYKGENPREHPEDPDDLIDKLDDELDSELTFNENVSLCYEKGFLQETSDWRENYDYEVGLMKDDILKIFEYPFYKCNQDNCEFECQSKEEMIQHFKKEHWADYDLEELYQDEVNKNNKVYIILKKLVDLATKEFKRKTYISVLNIDLHYYLLNNLEFKVSNQEPYHILKDLELLKRLKNQKVNPISLHPKSRIKIYNIHIKRLKEVVKKSSYDGLKIKLSVLDDKKREIVVKPVSAETPTEPTRPTRQNEQNSDEKSSGSSESDDIWKI